MPEDIQTQNPPQDDDMLEKLLAGAAQREADKKMKELEEKGVVTKAELSTVLKEFGIQLTETITSAVADQIKKATPPEAAQPTDPDQQDQGQQVQKAGQQVGQRKGTIQGASDPRSDNPIRYLIQKGRAGQEFDDLDRALIWGLTEKGFTQGMSYEDIDGPDFGDDSAYA
jgi:hypothetical protein